MVNHGFTRIKTEQEQTEPREKGLSSNDENEDDGALCRPGLLWGGEMLQTTLKSECWGRVRNVGAADVRLITFVATFLRREN